MPAKHELGDLLRENWESIESSRRLSGHQKRMLKALAQCRTAALGGHVDACRACGQVRISYNSYRNRHCPKCQGAQREAWISAREADLLSVDYFHLVFTLPSQLNALALSQPKMVYGLLFKAAWQTMQVFAKKWVIYAKRPFGGPRQVIEYLGRYTHKVAISNHRITELTEKKVAFSYKDYQKGGQKRRMSLEKEEFIRRFAMHILPSGFVRIRHYGFLASRYKAQKLQIARKTLGSQEVTYIDLPRESRPKPLAYDPQICPACGKKSMQTQEVFLPKRAPPLLYQV